MDQKTQIKTEIPGPLSQALRATENELLAPGLQFFAELSGIVVEKGFGSTVTDVDGNTFIDLIGGIGVNGLGHSHPTFVNALQKQLTKLSVGSFCSKPRVEFLKRLEKYIVPFKRTQLYSSGAEAVESALRLAKSFTKKTEFVSFWGGFHGKTMGALSLMGSTFKEQLGPLVPGNHIVPYANCYRCPLSLKYPSCGIECASLVRKQLKASTTGNIAAFIIEPMQGTSGNVIPPKEFLQSIKDISKELNALLITDEMITGFGRTGQFWGHSHSGVTPDIVTIGKQFGGGYPLSGILARDEIAVSKPWSNPSGSSSSYGGNPLASEAANITLQIIEEESLVEKSRNMGEYLLGKLKPFERFPFVGEVRGLGLFLGIEFVRDKITKEPLSKKVTEHIFKECLKRGLLTMSYTSSFRIQPSMNIDTQTIDEATEILDRVLFDLEEKKCWDVN